MHNIFKPNFIVYKSPLSLGAPFLFFFFWFQFFCATAVWACRRKIEFQNFKPFSPYSDFCRFFFLFFTQPFASFACFHSLRHFRAISFLAKNAYAAKRDRRSREGHKRLVQRPTNRRLQGVVPAIGSPSEQQTTTISTHTSTKQLKHICMHTCVCITKYVIVCMFVFAFTYTSGKQ